MLVKQQKSTTKPPYDPKPWTVISTSGNRVHMKRADGSRKTRDINQIKKTKQRPIHLIPSWHQRQRKTVSDYNQYDIDCVLQTNESAISSGVGDNPTVDNSDTAHPSGRVSIVNVQSQQVPPGDEPQTPLEVASSDNEQSNGSVEINTEEVSDMNAHLINLINAARQREAASKDGEQTCDTAEEQCKRTTRSQGHVLHWNPNMNPDAVLLEGGAVEERGVEGAVEEGGG